MCGEGASPTWTETAGSFVGASVRTLRCMCVCTTCNGLRFDVVITRSCHQKAPSHMKSSAARAPSSSKWRKHVSQRNPPRTKINGARSPRVPGAQCACQCASDGTQFWNMGPRHSPRPKYTLMDPHPVAVREITTANLAGAWSAQPVPVSDWSHSNGWLSSPLAREDEKGLEDMKVCGRLCHGPSYT